MFKVISTKGIKIQDPNTYEKSVMDVSNSNGSSQVTFMALFDGENAETRTGAATETQQSDRETDRGIGVIYHQQIKATLHNTTHMNIKLT